MEERLMTTKERNEILHGSTYKTKTGCGNIYITGNYDENKNLIEVFIRLGKAGGCASSQSEALGRLISIALRHGAELGDVIHQLRGIGCHTPVFTGMGNKNLSCADAVANVLSSMCESKAEPIEE